MSVARLIVAASFLVSTACGGPHQSPTSASPATSTPTPGNAPTVRVEIKVDDSSARDAIVQLSDVVVDTSGSVGTGSLTFSLDYGDGFVAPSSTAHHAYSAAGTYTVTATVTATVTDGQARKASDSRQVTVRSLTGSWFEAEYVQKSKRVEIRRLTVTAQDGLTIRGRYQVTSAADRAFTGALTSPRSARIVMDDGATLEGVIPDRLGDASANWIMQARGDTVDSERLEFRPITSDANSAPPDAVMKIQFGEDDAAQPIMGLTPVEIDGTASRGSGLRYFIEFGDGDTSSSSQAAHVVNVGEVWLTAQLTVVDSVGHSDSESMSYFAYKLNTLGDAWTSSDSFGTKDFWLQFATHTGANCTGSVHMDGHMYPTTAKLSGERSIQILAPTLGVEFSGEVRLGPGNVLSRMTLVQTGGHDDGRTWALHRYESY